MMGLFGIGGGGGNILDPLGLGSMLGGMLNPSEKGESGDVKGMATGIISMLTGGTDITKVFDTKIPEGAASGQPSGAEGPVTEMQPPSDPSKAADGYTKKPEPESKAKAEAATASDQPVSSSQAATKHEPMSKEEAKALETVSVNFDLIQKGWDYGVWGSDHDGLANFDNLRSYAADPKNPPHIREAVRYVLDHPEVLTHIQGMSGRNDGLFSGEGIGEYLKLRWSQDAAAAHASAAPPPAPKTPPAPPSGVENRSPATSASVDHAKVKADLNGGWSAEKTAAFAKASDDLIKSESASATSGATNAYEPKTFEEGLTSFDKKLGVMESEMTRLEGLALGGDTDAKSKLSSLTRQYQNFIEMRQEMHTLLSNLHKSFHEMSMSAINNIR